jgi:hypothetical protein
MAQAPADVASPGTLWPMSSSLSNLFAAAEEQTRELPMAPYAFGGLAMLGFLLLLGILWSFRGVAQATGEHKATRADERG